MAKGDTLRKTQKIEQTRLRLLGLTTAEEGAFLALLRTDPAGVSEIARAARMSRTTVDAALRRLAKRGLVRKLPHSYKSVWKVRELKKLKNAAAETIEYMEKENAEAEEPAGKKEVIGKIDAENIGIEVFRGVRQVRRAYDEILKLRRAERVFFVQGNKSVKKVFQEFEEDYFSAFHKKIKQRGIIMEGFAGEEILEIFKKMNTTLLRSHFGRLLVGRLIPDEYMDFALDIFVMRNKAFFVNLEQNVVIVIRFQPVVDALLSIAAALAALGRKVDLNAYLKELIEKKEEK